MKFETAQIHSLGNVQSLPLPWARFEGEGRACVLLSRAIAHLALHISYGLATRVNCSLMTWVENNGRPVEHQNVKQDKQ